MRLFSYGFYYFVGYETTAVSQSAITADAACLRAADGDPDADAHLNTHACCQRPRRVPVTETSGSAPATEVPVAASVTWDTDIAPLFTQKCLMCHGATASGGLILSTYADAMKGGVSGAVFTAGDSANSPMIVKV